MGHVTDRELERGQSQSKHDRILRDQEVRARTGLSRTTRWRLIRSKAFPAPVCITEHAVGWKESEVQAWIEARQPKHSPVA